ncbi:hypothetical protein WA538_002543 [Blastocystis sp. DL]
MNYPWKTICQSCKGKIVSSDGTIVDTVFEMPRLHCSVRIVSVNSHNVGLKTVISFAASILTDKTSTQVERNAYYLYQMVDFNRNGTLDCRELQTALSYGGLHFSLPTVNILLSKHDRNRNGQLEFEEFKTLLDEVWRWKDAFDYFDMDKSGSIDFQELQQALAMIG